MKHIILEAYQIEDIPCNIADLEAAFSTLTDPRNDKGKIYPLPMLLTMMMLAKLSGADTPSAICQWIRLRAEELAALFEWKKKQMPCLNTIRTVLQQVVSIPELEQVLGRYLHQTFGGQQSQPISIDGKTMRGTIAKGKTQGVHLLSAYQPEEGITLGQVEVGKKENEISAAPKLLAQLDLKNKVVCGDAMHTQRELSLDVLAGGGQYIWFLKANQSSTLADVMRFFDPIPTGCFRPPLPQTTARTQNRGHGREEVRYLTLIEDEHAYLDWPGVRQVFRLERQVHHLKSGETSCEVAYGITSCDPQQASAAQLLAWTRGYWGIENGLHYRRDVTLNEDKTRFSYKRMAQAMATFNNFIVGLSQKLGYENLAACRRVFDKHINRQLVLMTYH